MNKTKTKFHRITFYNRWKSERIFRQTDWTIIGLSRWGFSPYDFCISISFIGFDLKIWFKRNFE